MKLTNKTPNIAELKPTSNSNYELDYGHIETNGDSNVILLFETSAKNVQTKVSCGGCTKATNRKITTNQYEIYIYYKTSLLGRINKYVYIEFEGKKISIKLTGKVGAK